MVAAETKAGAPVGTESPGRSFSLWKEIIEPVHPFLERVAIRLAEQVHAFDPEIVPYAQYALTNQGKQLRPVLVALSAGATGKVNDSLVTVAVIIEMVHLATLVHDDIMDEAEIRRRRPTLAANWGNTISVLVGIACSPMRSVSRQSSQHLMFAELWLRPPTPFAPVRSCRRINGETFFAPEVSTSRSSK